MGTSWDRAGKSRQRAQPEAGADFNPQRDFAAPESEVAVLGRIMADPDLMGEVREILEPEDFAQASGAVIYQAMCDLWEERIPATLAIMMDRLKDEAAELMQVMQRAEQLQGYGPVFVTYHARIVADFAERRRFYKAMTEGLGRLVSEPGTKVQDVLTAIPYAVLKGGADDHAEGMDTLAERVFDRISKERTGEIRRRVVPSGFADVDRILAGGFEPGELIVLAARSGMGKTSVATHMLLNATMHGRAVFFSAEMDKEQIVRRIASMGTGISLSKIRENTTTDEEHEAIGAVMRDLKDVALTIDDTPRISSAQMLQRVQRIQASEPVSLVVFDYLELIGDKSKSGNQYERLSDAVVALKELAQRAGVPVVVLAQVGRSVEQRPDKRPNLTDLRMTGMLEQTADRVIFLYDHGNYVRRGMEEENEELKGKMEFTVAKNRNGAVGRALVGYDAEVMQFVDLSGPETQARMYDDAGR